MLHRWVDSAINRVYDKSIPNMQRGEKMINTNKLKAYMAEQGYNINKTASALNMSVPTYSRKLNNKKDFTVSEVLNIFNLLNITNPCEVFLPELSQMRNESKNAIRP